MTTTEAATTFHGDVVAALGELTEIATDSKANAGQYEYRYASLASIMRTVRPVLARHHLAVTQLVSGDNGELSIATVLVHISGGMHQSSFLRVKAPGTPQQIGSLVSYCRRYQLTALLGVAVAEEDDDGVAAKPKPPPRKRTAAAPKPKTPEAAMTARAMAMFGELGYASREDRLTLTSAIVGHDVASWNDLDIDQRRAVLDYLDGELAGPPEPEEGY